MCTDLSVVDVEKFVFSTNVYRLDIDDYMFIPGLHIVLESFLV